MQNEKPNPAELKRIQNQLGRPARHLVGIAKRCRYRGPEILLNHPLPRQAGDSIFFPTQYWLSCPKKVDQISRLEAAGAIQRLQARLQTHAGLQLQQRRAHAHYRRLRKKLAQGKPLPRAWLGIGGLRNPMHVKCLHLHYAHYRATSLNPIGAWVARQLASASTPVNDRLCQVCREKTAGVAEWQTQRT
jgi:uncharacterized protein